MFVNLPVWGESTNTGRHCGSDTCPYCVTIPKIMVPPRWPDEHGRLIPTYPCPRCGREVASQFRGFRVENLTHVGWALFHPTSYVNWCGHAQEVIPVPLADGRVTFVPVLGEAR